MTDSGKQKTCPAATRDAVQSVPLSREHSESEPVSARLRDLQVTMGTDGLLLAANRPALDFYGLTESELSGRNWLEFVLPEDQPELRESLDRWSARLIEGAVSEHRQLDITGEAHTLLWTLAFERDEQRLPVRIHALGRDLTEFRRTREACRAFVDHSLQGLIIVQDGRIVFANSAFEKMSQYTAGEIRTLPAGAFVNNIHPDDRAVVLDRLNRRLLGESVPEQYEYRAHRKDGSPYWVKIYAGWTMYRGRPAVQAALVDITERRRAQEDLKASRRSYDELFETAHVGIFIAQDGHIKHANRTVLEFVGLSSTQALEVPFLNLVHPDDRDLVAQRYTARMRGEAPPSLYDFRVLDAGGRLRWVEVSTALVEWEGKSATLNFINDITSRKEAEQALRTSEERYRLIFHNSPLGILQLDQEGTVIDCNEAMLQILGSTRQALIGFNMLTQIRDNRLLEAVRNTVEHGSGFFEGYYKSVTGAKRTPIRAEFSGIFSDTGAFRGAVGICDDITERLVAEEELQQSKLMYRTLAEHSTDVIMRFDREYRHLYANRAAEEATGIPCAEFIGKTHQELGFDEELVRVWETGLERVFRTGESLQMEFSHTIAGALQYFDTRLVPEMSSSIVAQTVLATSRNITETKRLVDFAARAQRLETAGRVAGQVAHDFNNLLGPLMAYPELIRAELPQDHPALDYLDDMERAAEQISDINQQLLTLGRRGHYNLEPLNINSVVELAVRQVPTPAGVDLRLELAEDIMNIRGGGSQILRVLTNLISNACDAIQGTGQVTLRTENYYVDRNSHRRVPVGEYVRLTVSDTGSGIPAEVQPKIFDPFFTTKTTDRKRGSGLGLSVVHAVIEDHGGYLDFKSVVGEGTSMYAYFPITREHTGVALPTHLVGGTESILVVDDDQVQRDVTQKLLEKLGYRVRTAECGETASEIVRNEVFDLIILDMIMPNGMDGADTLHCIRKVVTDQKALIVSGYAESHRVKAALEAGAHEFIRKPLTLKTVAQAVRRALDREPC